MALESVLFDIFQLDNDPFEYPKIPGAHDYLIEAAMADNPPSGTFYDPDHPAPVSRLSSLGVFEHWNNPIDRKYSRNLGTGNGIELLFIEQKTNSPVNKRTYKTTSGYSIQMLSQSNVIKLSIPESGRYSLLLLNSQGRVAASLNNYSFIAGSHQLSLSAIKQSGNMASGRYILSLHKHGKNTTEAVSQCAIRIFK